MKARIDNDYKAPPIKIAEMLEGATVVGEVRQGSSGAMEYRNLPKTRQHKVGATCIAAVAEGQKS